MVCANSRAIWRLRYCTGFDIYPLFNIQSKYDFSMYVADVVSIQPIVRGLYLGTILGRLLRARLMAWRSYLGLKKVTVGLRCDVHAYHHFPQKGPFVEKPSADGSLMFEGDMCVTCILRPGSLQPSTNSKIKSRGVQTRVLCLWPELDLSFSLPIEHTHTTRTQRLVSNLYSLLSVWGVPPGLLYLLPAPAHKESLLMMFRCRPAFRIM